MFVAMEWSNLSEMGFVLAKSMKTFTDVQQYNVHKMLRLFLLLFLHSHQPNELFNFPS